MRNERHVRWFLVQCMVVWNTIDTSLFELKQEHMITANVGSNVNFIAHTNASSSSIQCASLQLGAAAASSSNIHIFFEPRNTLYFDFRTATRGSRHFRKTHIAPLIAQIPRTITSMTKNIVHVAIRSYVLSIEMRRDVSFFYNTNAE